MNLSLDDALSADRLHAAIVSGSEWLINRQQPEGFWVGTLESNSCMEAQWVLAMHFLGIRDDHKLPGVIQGILHEQRSDGSWEVYHDAPAGDINSTVECYAALRASGLAPDDHRLEKARLWILEHGGLSETRVFTRYWLALIGEWPWEPLPVLPPELIALPNWFPINLYEFASWARATIVPLSVLSARRPQRPLPSSNRLDELFPEGREAFNYRSITPGKTFSWDSLFVWFDRLLNSYARFPFRPGRESAIRLSLEWILKHQDADGAWGGIQPPWIYSLLALHVEGYALTHPVLAKGLAAFDAHWKVERNGGLYLQASESPVWDTIWTLIALQEADYSPATCVPMRQGIEWLLDQQNSCPGDWCVKVRGCQPGGWAFQRANVSYPDVDDTAAAVLALCLVRKGDPDQSAIDTAIQRAVNWLLAMQSSNGGWASFDRDNTSRLVTKIPFCDFGEVLDPPTVDVTAHVLEALAHTGFRQDHPAVARALRFLLQEQEDDGAWFGRWGVNYIYGIAAVLPALSALGFSPQEDCLVRAAEWLVVHQNDDGGWGESPASYIDDSLRGHGESTPSQTAWALMSLLSLKTNCYAETIRRGMNFLLDRQEQGTWEEPQYTGTGFPGYGVGSRFSKQGQPMVMLDQGCEMARGFMLNYNLYRHYFPLIALARVKAHLPTDRAIVSPPPSGSLAVSPTTDALCE